MASATQAPPETPSPDLSALSERYRVRVDDLEPFTAPCEISGRPTASVRSRPGQNAYLADQPAYRRLVLDDLPAELREHLSTDERGRSRRMGPLPRIIRTIDRMAGVGFSNADPRHPPRIDWALG